MNNLQHRLDLIHELDQSMQIQSKWQGIILAQREINGSLTVIEIEALKQSYIVEIQMSKMRSYLIMEDVLC